jgi:hypothetical protein
MRKADLTKNHDWFEVQINWYMDFLTRIKDAQSVIKESHDKTEIVEASMLRICALWESFVEEELVDCLNLDCSKYSEYLGLKLKNNMPRNVCAAVLLSDRYRDFKSVGDIKGFAKKILCEDNNPFALIEDVNVHSIDDLYKIRNFLSHESRMSKRALLKMYQESYHLNNFVRPGHFLLSHNARKLVQYIKAFYDASQEMRNIIT